MKDAADSIEERFATGIATAVEATVIEAAAAALTFPTEQAFQFRERMPAPLLRAATRDLDNLASTGSLAAIRKRLAAKRHFVGPASPQGSIPLAAAASHARLTTARRKIRQVAGQNPLGWSSLNRRAGLARDGPDWAGWVFPGCRLAAFRLNPANGFHRKRFGRIMLSESRGVSDVADGRRYADALRIENQQR